MASGSSRGHMMGFVAALRLRCSNSESGNSLVLILMQFSSGAVKQRFE